MAAVLKKRALAEYSHVIQEESKPAPKKLKLVYRVKQPETVLDLHGCGNSQEVLQALLKLEHSLPVNTEQAEQIVKTLLDHFPKENAGHVRAKMADLLGRMAATPAYKCGRLMEQIINILHEDGSHTARGHLICAILSIAETQPLNTASHQAAITAAAKHLKDSSHQVRCRCLQLFGQLGSPDIRVNRPGSDTLQGVLGEFTQDTDSRVRSAAIHAMVRWHERGVRLSESLYQQACQALTDDYEGVRLGGIQLIWILAQLFPNSIIKVSGMDEEIRLIDDGFVHICNMVNDLSWQVRVEAATRLGSLHGVSPHFLEQTLDKKLMSNMRRKQTAHERNREHFESGEWSTGQKWADDAPKEQLTAEGVTIMPGGACGAFVHGLEDEYLEVRNASIDSLCELASNMPPFASLCQDFLVDMLNDEIESVRLNGVRSLRKISQHLVLREDQLEIILGALQDFSRQTREALHELFHCVSLAAKAGLHRCVLALLDNMRRYPQDRLSIWKAMCQIGCRHSAMVLCMVPDLISSHPYFESIEPDVDDPAYISILVLVFNAAVLCPTMPSLFPSHIVRHYRYLRDTLPDLVPRLQLQGVSFLETRAAPERSASPTLYLQETLGRLENLQQADTKTTEQLIQTVISDLGRVGEVEERLSATASCHALYLQCQLFMAKALSQRMWHISSTSTSSTSNVTSSLLNKVIEETHKLSQIYVGQDVATTAAVRQLRLCAQSLQLLLILQSGLPGSKAACIRHLQILSPINKLLSSNGLEPSSFTRSMLAELHRLEWCEPSTYQTILQGALLNHHASLLPLTNTVKQAKCEIVEPARDAETAIKFMAGLTASVDLVAEVTNVQDVSGLRVQVRYPDQQIHTVLPPPTHITQLTPFRHRLTTPVLLSHTLWSESSSVEVSVVLLYTPDQSISTDRDKPADKTYIQLADPVKVLIAPKPPK